MENPYIIWLLMCNINSMERDDLLDIVDEAAENFGEGMSSLDELKSFFLKGKKLLSLIDKNLLHYEETGDEAFLEEIEDINEELSFVFDEIYGELSLFSEFMGISKEDFLEREGRDRAENSSLFRALNLIVNDGFDGNLPEEDIWNSLDELREVIYDNQDEGLLLLEKLSKEAPPEVSHFFKELTGLFEKGLSNIEEGLEGIERAFSKGDKKEALESLIKAKEGMGETGVFEMITEAGGLL